MSLFLQISSRFLMKIMLLLSILLVFRGHNFPGGGFIGALVAASAIALYTIAFGLKQAGFDRWAPRVISLGLVCFLLSIILPHLLGQVMLQSLWLKFNFFGHLLKVGSPVLFDFGVYFCIVGGLIWIVAEIESEE